MDTEHALVPDAVTYLSGLPNILFGFTKKTRQRIHKCSTYDDTMDEFTMCKQP